MDRRKFLQFLGAGAAATAAGILVPDVARRFFLSPTGGWAIPLKVRYASQWSVSDDIKIARYDAVWTLPDGTEEQYGIDAHMYSENGFPAHQDETARAMLERLMRQRGGTPGSTYFKLELPRNVAEARWV